jgi:hypothetical protein
VSARLPAPRGSPPDTTLSGCGALPAVQQQRPPIRTPTSAAPTSVSLKENSTTRRMRLAMVHQTMVKNQYFSWTNIAQAARSGVFNAIEIAIFSWQSRYHSKTPSAVPHTRRGQTRSRNLGCHLVAEQAALGLLGPREPHPCVPFYFILLICSLIFHL